MELAWMGCEDGAWTWNACTQPLITPHARTHAHTHARTQDGPHQPGAVVPGAPRSHRLRRRAAAGSGRAAAAAAAAAGQPRRPLPGPVRQRPGVRLAVSGWDGGWVLEGSTMRRLGSCGWWLGDGAVLAVGLCLCWTGLGRVGAKPPHCV